MDRRTIEVYNTKAERWTADRAAISLEEVGWVASNRLDGSVLDVGCGPGWHLDLVTGDHPPIGADASASMTTLAAERRPEALVAQADAADLPFASASFGGAVASRVYQHLDGWDLPMALADLHRVLRVGAPVFIHVFAGDRAQPRRSEGVYGGRLFHPLHRDEFADLVVGAGFEIHSLEHSGDDDLRLLARRGHTLADTVGAGMRVLVCGLNPSPYSADTGVGFGRPGNRFWPAALAAGLVTTDRDPWRAFRVDRVGMTDLVKRTTRTAAALDEAEYVEGLARVERLVSWLQPTVVCFVGLAGWRVAVDAKATPGWQEATLGDRPVYVLPSTSGLNAHTKPANFIAHLGEVVAAGDTG